MRAKHGKHRKFLSGLGYSLDEINALVKDAKELGKNTGFTLAQCFEMQVYATESASFDRYKIPTIKGICTATAYSMAAHNVSSPYYLPGVVII